jgi:hypothetical protein
VTLDRDHRSQRRSIPDRFGMLHVYKIDNRPDGMTRYHGGAPE